MNSTTQHYTRGVRISIIGVIVNAALAVVKLVAGLVGNSSALVADAIESMADIVSSIVVTFGLHVAAQPPDAEHPYGHGRAEPLAALLVSVFLVGAALSITIESVQQIVSPHGAPAAFTLWVLLGVIAAKELLYRVVRRVGHEVQSAAVLADAWHHRSDALTSAAAAIGISITLIGGPAYRTADEWAALFAAGVIAWNAWLLARRPLRELMDAEPTATIEAARSVARSVPGVSGIEKVLARKSGLRFWIDMHVEVDPEMAVREAHRVAHAVKDAVKAAMPEVEDVLIHIEPFGQRAGADLR